MVRDEVDVVGFSVQHLLRQGVDHVLLVDHGSVDGTAEVLRELARTDPRVHVGTQTEPTFLQSETVTLLARRAWAAGADWVIPFDADELWFAEGTTLSAYLSAEPAEVVIARFHHMVPVRPITSLDEDVPFLLDATPSFPCKAALRSHPLAIVIPGNHDVVRVGARVERLHVAHAQYRSPAQVARKLRQGAAGVAGTGFAHVIGEHWRDGSRLDDDVIDEVWAVISRGRPDERIHFLAAGPMVEVRPWAWPHWDPDGAVPRIDVPRPRTTPPSVTRGWPRIRVDE
jgi:hypothetical protein